MDAEVFRGAFNSALVRITNFLNGSPLDWVNLAIALVALGVSAQIMRKLVNVLVNIGAGGE